MWGNQESRGLEGDIEPLIHQRDEDHYSTVEIEDGSPSSISYPPTPAFVRERKRREDLSHPEASQSIKTLSPSLSCFITITSLVFKLSGAILFTVLTVVIISGLMIKIERKEVPSGVTEMVSEARHTNLNDSSPVCSSHSWSNGQWIKRQETKPVLNNFGDILHWSGFPASYCTCNRLPKTNLGVPWDKNNTEENWDWRAEVGSYRWQPGCEQNERRLKPQFTPQSLINDLVQEGGWLLIGDSLSAQWFLSLSCILAPYVRAVPFWTTEVPWNATQHLYLDLKSPYVQEMKLPLGFDVNVTPVVTILRSGLLLSKPEIIKIIDEKNLLPGVGSLLWNETVFDNPPSVYLDEFLNPKLRYSKLVASAGAHYTSKLFNDLPLEKVTSVFHHAFEHWVKLITKMLEDPRAKDKKVLYRTATAGHRDCHEPGRFNGPPLTEEEALEIPIYNWQVIPIFNRIAEAVMSKIRDPRFQFMSIDRPAMLRPDGHLLIDCLHYTVGTGVIEGWTDFVYSYI